MRVFRLLICFFSLCGAVFSASAAAPLKVLFLGDNGHHVPSTRLRELAPEMLNRGIQLVYTEDLAAITVENLKRYDAILVYANIDFGTNEAAQAIVDYVKQGGGLVAVHCASFCFRNSDAYVSLVGGQFQSHAAISAFRSKVVAPTNPLMIGYDGIETTGDEPYVHSKHNEQNRTVLETRESEPYTWTRTEGKGRMFYTAWGHDQRTWTLPAFHSLIERGIRYAAAQTVPAALSKTSVSPFEFEDATDAAKVPFYSNEPGSAGNGANPWPKIQKPLPVAKSMERIIVPGGFELQLFASDPDIKKPIAMAWDERGRCWILETVDYPNNLLPPGQRGNDRIVICEDTNKDGKADKFTVFADGLNAPSSLTFSNGGVIVHQAPNTLFLKDTNGDDKADVSEILLTGWGRNDTHAVASNLQYGPDNWIWGIVGYSGFGANTGNGGPGGATVGGKWIPRFQQAFYRFKADGSAIEHIRNNNNNSWGLGFSETGLVFGSTANNVPSVFMPIPQRYYEPAGLTASTLASIADTSRYLPITTKVREVDVFWGYTAAAGHALYTARSYPKEYWNRVAFVAEPTGHLVGQFNLEADGAGFKSKNPTNLFVSDDEWSAPIMAEVGPDGSVWVIDWYNYVVQHNPTPAGFKNGQGNAYENPLRDKLHGRIYRVVWKDGKPSQQPDLHNAKPEALVAALKNDNMLWRKHAQRLLVERGRKDVVPALVELVKDQSVDEIGLNVGAIHALWTLQGLNAFETYPSALTAAIAALKHPSAGVRRNAATVLPRSAPSIEAIADSGVLKDSDPQVRLAAMLALADAPDIVGAGRALHDMLAASSLTLDRWSADAAKMAATAQSRSFLAVTTTEEIAAAHASLNQGVRTILDSALLAKSAALPADLTVVKTAGDVEVTRANAGHSGANSLSVALKGEGAAGGASTKVKVKRNFRYELIAWVKTDGLPAAPAGGRGARGGGAGRGPGGGAPAGATLSLVQAPGARGGGGGAGGGGRGGANQAPTTAYGTSDWTQIRVPITTTANQDEVTVLMSVSLGATGTAAGRAWFDDVAIREVGPTDESITEPLNAVINHLEKRNGTAALNALAPTVAIPAPSGPAATVVNLGVIPDMMKYDKAELTVKAGAPVRLVFKNNDHMQHNFLLLRPGTIEAVGALADKMLTDPTALAKSYIPDSQDVLASTPLVNPGETTEVTFTAPTAPGRYPYVCTFPGHWRIMQGTLIVTP